MRQAAFYLVVVLAIINALVAAAAPLLENGDYRIFTGSSHTPKYNRYFTGKKDARTGSVTLQSNSTSPFQVWRLRNRSNGQVTLESLGAKGYYLSEGRSGALPGAHVGLTKTKQRWGVSRVAGGPFTRYALAHPRKFNNKTLLVGESADSPEPKYVAFVNEDTPETIKAWKFTRL